MQLRIQCKSLVLLVLCLGLFEGNIQGGWLDRIVEKVKTTVVGSSNVEVKNGSDEPIYAAIYYTVVNSDKASDIATINPGDSVKIDLPSYKLGKSRNVFVTKYRERLTDSVGAKEALTDFFGCVAEVGIGRNAHVWVMYKGGILVFSL